VQHIISDVLIAISTYLALANPNKHVNAVLLLTLNLTTFPSLILVISHVLFSETVVTVAHYYVIQDLVLFAMFQLNLSVNVVKKQFMLIVGILV